MRVARLLVEAAYEACDTQTPPLIATSVQSAQPTNQPQRVQARVAKNRDWIESDWEDDNDEAAASHTHSTPSHSASGAQLASVWSWMA